VRKGTPRHIHTTPHLVLIQKTGAPILNATKSKRIVQEIRWIFLEVSLDLQANLPYVYSMLKRKELEAQIGELASALEIMNENATTETALTVKVANEVFGRRLAEMQKELVGLEAKGVIVDSLLGL